MINSTLSWCKLYKENSTHSPRSTLPPLAAPHARQLRALDSHDDDWKEARTIAEESNYKGDANSRHFHVDPFLKMTTGLSLEYLSALIERKDRIARKEEEQLLAFDRPKRAVPRSQCGIFGVSPVMRNV